MTSNLRRSIAGVGIGCAALASLFGISSAFADVGDSATPPGDGYCHVFGQSYKYVRVGDDWVCQAADGTYLWNWVEFDVFDTDFDIPADNSAYVEPD